MTLWFDDKSKKYVGRNEGEYLVKRIDDMKTELDDAIDDHKHKEELDHPDQSVKGRHIADNVVTAEKIAADAIITNKIKDGNITEAKIALAAVTTEKIMNGNITEAKIKDGAVTASKLYNNAVTAEKIADGNITEAKIKDGAVTTSKIYNNAVTAEKIGGNAVLNRNLANGVVTAEKIAEGAVRAGQIADGAVTYLKIADENVRREHLANGIVTAEKLDQATVKDRLELLRYDSSNPSNIAINSRNNINDDATGINNIGVGASFANLTTGTANTALGNNTLSALTMGSNNVAVGYNTLGALTTADNSTAIGAGSGAAITTGDYNVGIGAGSLGNITTGTRNTAVGAYAISAQSKDMNPGYTTAIGYNAGRNISGNDNVLIGYNAGRNISGSGNVYIGYNVGTGSTENNTLLIGAGVNGVALIEGNVSKYADNNSNINNTVTIKNVLRTKNLITLPEDADEGSICTHFMGNVLLKRNGTWDNIYTVPTQEPINTPYNTGRCWINGSPVYRINLFYKVSGQDLINCGGNIFKGNFADMVDNPQQASGINLTTETINSLLRITDGDYADAGLLSLTDMNSVQLNEDASYYIIPQGYTINSQNDYNIFGYIEYLCDLTGNSSTQIDISKAKELNIPW